MTLIEMKRAAWSGRIEGYRITAPLETRKLWKPTVRHTRRSA